ncbi:MAG TPA: CvpA family protein [Parafilimonas sp.]|nr:CvpA family protein [Parafilimonas sp.]
MIIDIVFVILLALAVIRGIGRGFIVAIFSFIAIIIGVAAAMKLSFIVTGWLQESFHTGKQWLPILSFLIVFIGVVLLIRWLANLIQAAIKMVMLGWLNKLGGVVLYILIYLFVYSIVLFYLTKMGFIRDETIAASRTYAIVEPFGVKAIEILGKIIPFFKDIFQQLSDFFEKIATHNA